MTQEEKDIVLHGAKFEMMNRCIDWNDGTVDREKMLNAMQIYAEMYHDNELSKLRQHDVSICACGSDKLYSEQYKDVVNYYCSKCHKNIESKH